MTAPSSGSRRPNAARERSRVQNLRDGIEMIITLKLIYATLRLRASKMARADVDRYRYREIEPLFLVDFIIPATHVASLILSSSFPIFAVGTAGRPAQHQTLQTGRPPHGERLHRPSRPTGPGRRRRRRPAAAAAAAANEFQFKRRRHFPPRQGTSYIRPHKEIASRSV